MSISTVFSLPLSLSLSYDNDDTEMMLIARIDLVTCELEWARLLEEKEEYFIPTFLQLRRSRSLEEKLIAISHS